MQLTLAQGYSLTTMLAVAAVAILLTAGFYYRAFRTLRARQWQMLLALRVVAILLVVMLLFRPVFSYQNELDGEAGGDLPAGYLVVDEHCRRRHGRNPLQPGPRQAGEMVREAEGRFSPAADRVCRAGGGARRSPGTAGPGADGQGHVAAAGAVGRVEAASPQRKSPP